MIERLRIVSRKSALALWQTHFIESQIKEHHPGIEIEIVTMDTLGDRIRDKPLPEIGAKGLFTIELEEALLEERAELAVHSLKDLPSDIPNGLVWIGSPKRADASDALISFGHSGLSDLPQGATIATGSVRRRAQLRSTHPTLNFEELRGNIDTRIQKLQENGWDAIIMATAALHRLQRHDLISEVLPVQTYVPAVSQGAIGVEIKASRTDVAELLTPIFCPLTTQACTAERHFMSVLQGGCSVSLGAYARQNESVWQFSAWISNPTGTQFLRETISGTDPMVLARQLVATFQNRGAAEILGRT